MISGLKMESKEKRIENILLVICVLQILFIIFMNFFNMKYMVDYDSSTALMHAKEIWKQKTLFVKDWGYQTTLDIDSLTGLVALLYGMTNNILLAQAMGNFIIIIAYIWVLNGIFKCMELKNSIRNLGIILFFIPYTIGQLGYASILFSSVSWYSVKIFLVLLSVYIVFKMERGEWTSKSSFGAVVACFCALLTGISSGFYILLCGIFPLFFYEIIHVVVNPQSGSVFKRKVIFESLLLLSGMIGIVIQRRLGYATKDTGMVLASNTNWISNITSWFVGIYQLFGGIATDENTLIFSAKGICILANWGIVTILLLVLALNIRKRFIEKRLPYQTGILVSIIFVNSLILTLAYTTYGGNTFEFRYHTIPALAMMFVCLQFCNEMVDELAIEIKKGVIFLTLVLVLISLVGGDLAFWKITKEDGITNVIKIGEEIKNNNIQNVVVIGEPNIVAGRCLRVFSGNANVITVDESLQDTSSTTWGGSKKYLDNKMQKGHIAVVTQKEIFENLPEYIKASLKFYETIENYDIYVGDESKFDFVSGMNGDKGIDYPYSPNYICQNGSMQNDGTYISNNDGGVILYGPYAPRMDGTWSCVLDYEVLSAEDNLTDVGDFSVTANNGQKLLASEKIKVGESKTVINAVTADYGDTNIEMKVTTLKGVEIKIKSIEMQKENR